MNLQAFLVASVLTLASVNAEVTFIDHDQVEPFAQPEPTTDSEKAAVKFKPQLLVSYGCHPYPAVQADGSVSAGLKGTGSADGECTDSDLGSQVYSRSDWYEDKWAIMYTWYLPKGSRRVSLRQRRHYWLTAVVWIDDPALTNSTILGASVNYGWRFRSNEVPVNAEHLDGSSVKLDSYRAIGAARSRLQLTEEEGESQDLITWEQLTEEALYLQQMIYPDRSSNILDAFFFEQHITYYNTESRKRIEENIL